MLFRFNDPFRRPPRATWSCIACGCAFALALLGNIPSASAEYFTYSTSVAPGLSTTTPGGVTVALAPLSDNTPGDNLFAGIPGTDIVFGNISVTGLTNSSVLEAISIPYTFHVSISDFDSDSDLGPANGTVDFDVSGTLGGTVGAGKQVNITNIFSQAFVFHDISGEGYLMNLFSYVPPGSRPINLGAFGAHVVARVPDPTTPEPSTIVLLGFGALALAAPAYRRWQRNTPRSSG